MTLEDELCSQGFQPICGVDEAGRGPLAGPVVAAAVIMPPCSPLRSLVRDSKSVSRARRESIYRLIVSSPEVHWAVFEVGPVIIDRENILRATLLAMREAVSRLTVAPAYVLVDGNATPELDCPCRAVVRGDATEPAIMAASIVAKVTRDAVMGRMDRMYPGYGFARHKGYPTREHYEALRRLGACPIHRRTFRGVS
jgi:ribonuclease HII